MNGTTTVPEEYKDCFGRIEGTGFGHHLTHLEEGMPWVLDNGAFTGRFTEKAWHRSLKVLQPFKDTCILCTIPDVVGDRSATLARFEEYLPAVREYGYPAAIVTQDGMTVIDIPWKRIDAIFIGGTNEHKFSDDVQMIITTAQAFGIWVHVGRVNSAKRMHIFWTADSWDGTTISYAPDERGRIIGKAVREIRERKKKLWSAT